MHARTWCRCSNQQSRSMHDRSPRASTHHWCPARPLSSCSDMRLDRRPPSADTPLHAPPSFHRGEQHAWREHQSDLVGVLCFSLPVACRLCHRAGGRRCAACLGGARFERASMDALTDMGCAGLANGFSSAVLNPSDVTKIRLQSPGGAALYSGLTDCVSKICAEEGASALWLTGLTSTLMREALYSTTRMGLYAHVKTLLGVQDSSLSGKIVAGGVTGSLGSIIANPIDVVKVSFMAEGTPSPRPCPCLRPRPEPSHDPSPGRRDGGGWRDWQGRSVRDWSARRAPPDVAEHPLGASLRLRRRHRPERRRAISRSRHADGGVAARLVRPFKACPA